MTKEIIIAVVSALIGGFITFLFSVLLEKRKEKREDSLEAKKHQREAFQNRPEMQIVDYKDYISRVGYGIKQNCDINVFVAHIANVSIEGDKKQQIVQAHYENGDINQEEWCCVIYTMKNAGKTDIFSLRIVSTFQKDTCVFPSEEVVEWERNHLLNYSEYYDEKIRVDDTIKLKVCFHKDRIIKGMFSAALSVIMIDDNGQYWEQPLFIPQDKVYDSRRISPSVYLELVKTKTAEECFKKPWLW